MITDEKFKRAYVGLWPTGRAWNFIRGSFQSDDDLNAFVDGLDNPFTDGFGNIFTDGVKTVGNKSANFVNAKIDGYLTYLKEITKLLDQKHPGSKYYTFEDTKNWERVYGIVPSEGATEEERTAVVLQRIQFPNGRKARGTADYIEDQLRGAGFDVYVHENRFPASYIETQAGSAQCGVNSCGSTTYTGAGTFEARVPESGYTELVANYLDPVLDENVFDERLGTSCGNAICGVSQAETDYESVQKLSSYFFISDEIYPNPATVPSERREELRQMILKLKPGHSIVFTYINYI